MTERRRLYHRLLLGLLIISLAFLFAEGGCGSDNGSDSAGSGPLGLEFVSIPAGSFTMGSPQSESGRWSDEGPQHTVTLTESFEMSATEITNEQFVQFLNATGRVFTPASVTPPAPPAGTDLEPEDFATRIFGTPGNYMVAAGYTDHPAVEVDWADVNAFVDWMTATYSGAYRLPSEAEWEYACRAGSETARYWGDELGPDNANCAECDDQYIATAPVGSFPANAWGLFDMLGNVHEWCLDWYDSEYYTASPEFNPQNTDPSSGKRVLRGGSWANGERLLRCAFRNWNYPDTAHSNDGFRIVRFRD